MPAPLLLLLTVLLGAPLTARADDLMLLLQSKSCPNCELADADLVHADLRNANLKAADLQRANLGQARLDGADLRGTDLRWTNLRGASLRGVDLRNSDLYGTDLRQADLTGARLNIGSLEQSHWVGARGIASHIVSHASLHNAGVAAAHLAQWYQAEHLFSAAIDADPNKPISWIARGLCRGELGHLAKASEDFAHAGELLHQRGDPEKSDQLFEASRKAVTKRDRSNRKGNGIDSRMMSGNISASKALATMALQVLPLAP